MFLRFILLVVSLISCLRDVYVSSCDVTCTAVPVFTPPRLVVKHGDPTSATCTICQSACPKNLFGFERSVGVHTTKGPTIEWKVEKMTEWNTSAVCYYNVDSHKCCGILPVTVYKPPDSLSVSFDNHSEPMIEGDQYTLRCEVHNVAPVRNLSVTFYRGQTPLGSPQFKSNTQKTPVTEVYTLSITATKEDDGGQFWCKAQLELGPEGPQPPPVVKSSRIVVSVNSKAVALISSLNIFFMLFIFSLV